MAFVDEESCPGAQAAYRPVIGDGQDIVSHGRHPSVVNSGPTFSHQGNRPRKAGPYLPVISRSKIGLHTTLRTAAMPAYPLLASLRPAFKSRRCLIPVDGICR